MKKIGLMLGALACMLYSCSTISDDNPEKPVVNNTIQKISSMSQTFGNGTQMTVAPFKTTRATRGAEDVTVSTTTLVLTSDERKRLINTHIENFPERTNNLFNEDKTPKDHSNLEGYSCNYMFRSTGEPFQLIMLYTYYYPYTGDQLYLYWLDENGEFTRDNTILIWEETATGDELTKKRNSKYLAPPTNDALQVTLPKDTYFGFMFWNNNELTYHYSNKNFNTTAKYQNLTKVKDLQKDCDASSMITYVEEGYQIISMDGTFPMTTSYDADVNDIVFLMTPPAYDNTVNVIANDDDDIDISIDIEGIDKEILCDVDDFALSNNVERYPELYNIGANPNRKIFVEKDEKLSVKIDSFKNLVFNEEYNEWTYETWIWLNTTPAENKYLIGSELLPDWENYSNDSYDIGVSAYQGKAGHDDTGYVKVSVHIKKK